MPVKDEGGFDLVMEVAQNLLLDFARATPIPSVSSPVSFAGINGTLTFKGTVDNIVLGTFPNVNVSVNVTGTTMVATSVPYPLTLLPPEFLTINVAGDVAMPVPLGVNGLKLVADFSKAGTPSVSDAVFNSILTAPLIEFLLFLTILQDPSGALYAQTVQLIKSTVTQQIQSNVASVGTPTLLDVSPLSSGLLRAIGSGISNFQFGFGSSNDSIFLLFTINGVPGTFSLISRSDLPAPRGLADLIVSNTSFLRDFMKPAVSTALGLNASGFLPGAPFVWGGAVLFPPAIGGAIATASITSALAGIDGTNIRLLLGATATGILSSFTVTTSIDITITLSVSISATSLTLTLTPLTPAAVTSSVSIAWWVYVVGFLIGGFTADAIIAIANAIGPSIANGIITGALASAFAPITTTIPLPPGAPPLSVQTTSLGQADAPPTIVTIFGFSFPLPFAENDIIVGFD